MQKSGECDILSFLLKNPLIVLTLLIVIGAAMYPVGIAVGKNIPPQNPAEIAALPLGETVLNGTDVVNDNNIRKYPLIYHPEYLLEYAKEYKIWDLYISLTTGAAPTLMDNITGGSISDNGIAEGVKGSGMLTIQGNKLIVTNPTFVWGFKTPYTLAVKTKDGIELKQGNKTLKTVSEKDINNDTIPHQYMSLDEFKSWYNKSDVGNATAVDYALAYFNDGRTMVTPDKLKTYFGENVLKDMETHPQDQPIMAFNGAPNQLIIGDTSTIMNYYGDLDNVARAHNAKTFIDAWNNTIIPPHTEAHGSNNVSYVSVYDPDPNATVKWASHGTCPPGRALRDASLAAGFSLPTGMTMDYTDVISNFADLITGIRVENNGDYPIKIVMWSDGGVDGAGMSNIYAQIIQLRP